MKIFKYWKRNGDIAGTFIYFKNAEGKWLWELRGRNDQTMARSAHTYDNCSNAKMATESLRRFLAQECDIEESHEPLRRMPDIPGPDIDLVELALRSTLGNPFPSLGINKHRQFVLWREDGGGDVQALAADDTLAGVVNNYRSRE